MARAAFNETIASVAADGTLKAISNVQVEVRKVSDNSLAQLWNDRSASGGGNVVANPFVTGATGAVTFYAASGEYNITFTDQQAPPRIATQTIGWDSVPGSQTSEVTGFSMGDIKLGSQSTDHGRWLKMNGRELSQAEIESALSLSAGDAAAFVTYMGTGSGSMYGAAASSKVKLPDTRRKALLGAGPATDTSPTPMAGTTARPLGNTGGVETVTLTGDQSGVRTHTHATGTYAAGSHTHAAGTLVSASHTHGDGTLTASGHTHDYGTLAGSSHSHGPGTLGVASHTHGVGTFAVGSHSHADGTLVTEAHGHAFTTNTGAPFGTGTWTFGAYHVSGSAYEAAADAGPLSSAHVHTAAGYTSNDSGLSVSGSTSSTAPSFSGASAGTAPSVTTGATASATVAISGSTGSSGTDVTGATAAASPAVTGATAGATAAMSGSSGNPDTNTTGGSAALTAHDNMPPYITVGYLFIRV